MAGDRRDGGHQDSQFAAAYLSFSSPILSQAEITPQTPGHTALLVTFQPPAGYAGNVYEAYKAWIGERLHRLG